MNNTSNLPQGTQVAEDIPTAITNVINGSTPDPERPTLLGGVPQLNRTGNLDSAYSDFDSLSPSNVQYYDNGVKTGTLPDGYIAVVRPLSVPTIEIRDQNNQLLYKIRYKE